MSKKYFKEPGEMALRSNQKDYHPNQATRNFDENDSFLQEKAINEARLVECEKKLRQATFAFSRALDELNTVNAQLRRGPVNIKAELRRHCLSQEDLKEHYADEAAHYNVKLVHHLNVDRTRD